MCAILNARGCWSDHPKRINNHHHSNKLVSTYLLIARESVTSSRTFAARNTAVTHNHSIKVCLASTKWQIYLKIGTNKLKINSFKCWKWQLKWYNYMIRSYFFQNSRAFTMACATFETAAQRTLGTLACSAIYNSFSWNASLSWNGAASFFKWNYLNTRFTFVSCSTSPEKIRWHQHHIYTPMLTKDAINIRYWHTWLGVEDMSLSLLNINSFFYLSFPPVCLKS